MATESWPSSLPQKPLSEGFEEVPADNVIRTSMDQGPDKVRRETTANVETYQMTFQMDESQLSTFDDFFKNTIASGALKFDFDDPRDGNTYEWRIDTSQSPPTYTNVGGNVWRIRMVLEKLPNSQQP